MKKYPEEVQILLKTVVDHFQSEDTEVRERSIRQWKKLKLMWQGFTNTWYSEVAHDWRIWDATAAAESGSEQSYYDKDVNVFRAYLESIIAALSVTIPPVVCYPDDADNPLDLVTAKAGDKIASLIYRHNDVTLVWLHALFIYCTEGMVAAYSYSKSDKEYGEYEENIYEDRTETHDKVVCPHCDFELDASAEEEPPIQDELLVPPSPEPMMGQEGMMPPVPMMPQEVCPACGMLMTPEVKSEETIFTSLVDVKKHAKSRVCLEAYGGLNVKTPVYARKQSEMPYLIYSYETHYANVLEKFPHLRGKFPKDNAVGAYDQYEQWGRLPYQYMGDTPANNITVRSIWLRPSSFNILSDERDINQLKKLFPDGCKVVFINDEYAEACPENLDDKWTITHNPLADYIQYEPLGMLLTSIQEITTEIISLTLQTMEHGISQTFADPAVLNFAQYSQTEVLPGAIFPATPKSGKTMNDSFFEVRTATLSPEIQPFAERMQTMAQLVSGALPSLFGGQMTNTQTASEYSMSRSQAMQRLQNVWKMFTIWWKHIFAKSIPLYMDEMQEDERWVEKDQHGGFLNMFIRRAEIEGKIGRVEIEANEHIPLNWQQQKDIVMELLKQANPQLMGIIAHPDNLPFIKQALGLEDLYVPGEDDRTKQYEEITLLVASEPIVIPGIDPMTGQPIEQEMPSIEIDPQVDNHAIEYDICRKWLISDVGRWTKTENPPGYKNVLLHALAHKQQLEMQMMQQQMQQAQQGQSPNQEKPQENEAFNAQPPITGDNDVQTAIQ